MDAEQLIAEGLRLARPSWLLRLRRGDERLAGIWGGSGIIPSHAGALKHWVTVDCSWLSRQGLPLRGCLSLYQNDDESEFIAAVDKNNRLPQEGFDGIPLAGQEELAIPPCEALDVCGSELTRQWFEAGGGRDVGLAYDLEYQRRCPLYRDDVFAVLGGWHAFWPDMDAFDEEKGHLILWTFRDAEPWVEVWLEDSGRLKVIPRIT